MSLETLIPVEEYLSTAYDPDVEYVDGVLVERNAGDWLHSLVQRNVTLALTVKYPQVFAVPELRSQTSTTRYRLPDSVSYDLSLKRNTLWMPHSWPSKSFRKTTA